MPTTYPAFIFGSLPLIAGGPDPSKSSSSFQRYQFPIDIMHCVLTLFKLWIREKLNFEKDAPPSEDCHLSPASLKAISKSLATARGDIPTYLGHAPRQINRHYNGYKEAEWEA
jgi:hypothetical protein